MNGRQQVEAMARLAGVAVTVDERLAQAERHNAVLAECLGIAMRSMAFAALPTTRADLRLIRDKLAAVGVEVLA